MFKDWKKEKLKIQHFESGSIPFFGHYTGKGTDIENDGSGLQDCVKRRFGFGTLHRVSVYEVVVITRESFDQRG